MLADSVCDRFPHMLLVGVQMNGVGFFLGGKGLKPRFLFFQEFFSGFGGIA